MHKTYYGGAEDDPEEQEDTSTVDTDTSEIMKRLGANDENVEADEDEDESIFDSEDEAIEEVNEVSDNESMESDDEGEFRKDTSTKKTQAAAEMEDEDESNDSDDDDDDDDDDYLQKLDDSVRQNIIGDYHPEMMHHNDEEVETLCKIVRDADGVIIDPFHKTLPFVTKYEKARILGERAKQINSGAKPFVKVEKHIIDGYLIAMKEFEEKKIPFIIRRPLPNGGSEYWKLSDLQILD